MEKEKSIIFAQCLNLTNAKSAPIRETEMD